MRRFVLGICGASGGAYALRALRALTADAAVEVHLVVSAEGDKVLAEETGISVADFIESLPPQQRARIARHRHDDFFAPISSGSFRTEGMLVLPCSLSTLACIANGTGGDLLRRAADVHLKERRRLVIVPREMPLSTIHLRNMLALSEAGAVVSPASPGFYGKPTTVDDLVDFVAGRSLEALGFTSRLSPEWTGE